jgi:hypothetical protein
MVRFVCSLFVLCTFLVFSTSVALALSGSGEFAKFEHLGDMQQRSHFYGKNRNSAVNFVYTTALQQTVTSWGGSVGTGTILATLVFTQNDGLCTGAAYCTWVRSTFTGRAKSMMFSATPDGIDASDMTIRQGTTSIPEPSNAYLFVAGLAAVALVKMRRLWLA